MERLLVLLRQKSTSMRVFLKTVDRVGMVVSGLVDEDLDDAEGRLFLTE